MRMSKGRGLVIPVLIAGLTFVVVWCLKPGEQRSASVSYDEQSRAGTGDQDPAAERNAEPGPIGRADVEARHEGTKAPGPARSEPEWTFLEGRVFALETGRPLQGATVGLAPYPEDSAETLEEILDRADGTASVLTGVDGAYRLTRPERLEGVLFARASGFGQESIDAALVENPTDFFLRPLAMVTGRIAAITTGEPISGASVRAFCMDLFRGRKLTERSVLSGEDGTFILSPLPDGMPLTLGVSHSDYSPESLSISPPAYDLLIELSSGSIIRGKVTDETDAPLAGARVCVEGQESKGAVSAADGAYVIKGVRTSPPPFVVSASLAGYDDAHSFMAPAPEGTEQTVDLKLQGLCALRGSVRDAAGRPIPGVSVEVKTTELGLGMALERKVSALTESDGCYSIAGARKNSIVCLSFAKAEFARLEIRIETGPESLQDVEPVTMLAGSTLAVVVLEATNGAPVRGAQVRLLRPRDSSAPGSARKGTIAIDYTDEQGEVIFDSLSAGTYPVSIRTRDGRTGSQDIPVEGECRHVVSLHAGLSLTGAVKSVTHEPVQGARILLHDESGLAGTRTAVTSEDGRYAFSSLGPGSYILEVIAGGYSRHARPIQIADKDIEENADLEPGKEIHGRLVNEMGEPLFNYIVMAFPMGERIGRSVVNCRTGADGSFALSGLRDERYRLSAADPTLNKQLMPRSGPVVVHPPAQRLELVVEP